MQRIQMHTTIGLNLHTKLLKMCLYLKQQYQAEFEGIFDINWIVNLEACQGKSHPFTWITLTTFTSHGKYTLSNKATMV
jgi:hypothetical protein